MSTELRCFWVKLFYSNSGGRDALLSILLAEIVALLHHFDSLDQLHASRHGLRKLIICILRIGATWESCQNSFKMLQVDFLGVRFKTIYTLHINLWAILAKDNWNWASEILQFTSAIRAQLYLSIEVFSDHHQHWILLWQRLLRSLHTLNLFLIIWA